jgi:hypothetical protein
MRKKLSDFGILNTGAHPVVSTELERAQPNSNSSGSEKLDTVHQQIY